MTVMKAQVSDTLTNDLKMVMENEWQYEGVVVDEYGNEVIVVFEI